MDERCNGIDQTRNCKIVCNGIDQIGQYSPACNGIDQKRKYSTEFNGIDQKRKRSTEFNGIDQTGNFFRVQISGDIKCVNLLSLKIKDECNKLPVNANHPPCQTDVNNELLGSISRLISLRVKEVQGYTLKAAGQSVEVVSLESQESTHRAVG